MTGAELIPLGMITVSGLYFYRRFFSKKKCARCGARQLWFYEGEYNNLCDGCNKEHEFIMQQHYRILCDCYRIVDTTKKFDTAITRMALSRNKFFDIKDHLDVFGCVNPSSQKIRNMASGTLQLFQEKMNKMLKEMNEDVKNEPDLKKQKSIVSKVHKQFLKVTEDSYYDSFETIKAVTKEIEDVITSFDIQIIIEKGDLLVFQGKPQKALDKYREALFELDKLGEAYSRREDLLKEIRLKMTSLESK